MRLKSWLTQLRNNEEIPRRIFAELWRLGIKFCIAKFEGAK
jgi:hypothetical protein